MFRVSRLSGLNTTKEYIQFIRGGTTSHGMTFEEIMNYTDRDLEDDHAYIQWIFPLAAPSQFNPDAPVINIAELQNYPEAKEAMLRSYEKITKFWGLYSDPIDRKRLILLNGHNGLRFSRFLQSMVYHGHENLAEETLEKVKANLHILSPRKGRLGKTLWEELFIEAKEQIAKVNSEQSK